PFLFAVRSLGQKSAAVSREALFHWRGADHVPELLRESEVRGTSAVGRGQIFSYSGDNFQFGCQVRVPGKTTQNPKKPKVNCISDLPRALASVTLPGAGWGYCECIHLCRAAGAHNCAPRDRPLLQADHAVIVPLTVKEILDEEIARNLAYSMNRA